MTHLIPVNLTELNKFQVFSYKLISLNLRSTVKFILFSIFYLCIILGQNFTALLTINFYQETVPLMIEFYYISIDQYVK